MPMQGNQAKTVEAKRGLLVTAVLLTFLVAIPGFSEGFKNGLTIRNKNPEPMTLSFAWSGSFEEEEGECLDEEELTIPGNESKHVKPPDGFTPTDFVVNKIQIGGEAARGGFNYQDPPGEGLIRRVSVFCSNSEPVFSYVLVGGTELGPFEATVPVVQDGFDEGGVPRLFQALTDDETGRPVIGVGEKTCFLPTGLRINEPDTGELKPEFRFTGEAFACGETIFGTSVLDIPAIQDVETLIGLAVLFALGALWVLWARN